MKKITAAEARATAIIEEKKKAPPTPLEDCYRAIGEAMNKGQFDATALWPGVFHLDDQSEIESDLIEAGHRVSWSQEDDKATGERGKCCYVFWEREDKDNEKEPSREHHIKLSIFERIADSSVGFMTAFGIGCFAVGIILGSFTAPSMIVAHTLQGS